MSEKHIIDKQNGKNIMTRKTFQMDEAIFEMAQKAELENQAINDIIKYALNLYIGEETVIPVAILDDEALLELDSSEILTAPGQELEDLHGVVYQGETLFTTTQQNFRELMLKTQIRERGHKISRHYLVSSHFIDIVNASQFRETMNNPEIVIREMFETALSNLATDIYVRIQNGQEAEVEFRIEGILCGSDDSLNQRIDILGVRFPKILHTRIQTKEDQFYSGTYQEGFLMKGSFVPDEISQAKVTTSPLSNGGTYVHVHLFYAEQILKPVKYLGENDALDVLEKAYYQNGGGISVFSSPDVDTAWEVMVRSLSNIVSVQAERNIIIVDDNVWPHIPGITHLKTPIESNNDSWQIAILTALKSSPDLLVVGEVSDIGILKTLFQASLSGTKIWLRIRAARIENIPSLLEAHGIESNILLHRDGLRTLIGSQRIKMLSRNHSRDLNKKNIEDLDVFEWLRISSVPEAWHNARVRTKSETEPMTTTLVESVILKPEMIAILRNSPELFNSDLWKNNVLTIEENTIYMTSRGETCALEAFKSLSS
jgi:type II secretory ATPase GspE/PulE/Tfp pilus assembly ATPase PilB-like protein